MLHKTYLNTEGNKNHNVKIGFVHLFMIVFSVILLNRFLSSIYPILFLLALEFVFFMVKKKISVNYIMLAWVVNIGIIAVRTVTWDQANIKIFLSYVVALRVLPLMASEFYGHYFNGAFAGNPISEHVTQLLSGLKNKTVGKVAKYGKDVAKHQINRYFNK